MSTTTESLKVAVEHQRAGRLDEAERICRQILEAEPQNTPALHLMGVLAHLRGRHAAAADYLTRAVILAPDEPTFHASLAAVRMAMGRSEEAIACLREVLRLRPDHAETYNNLGVLMANLGRMDEAAKCFRQGLRIKPDYAPAHNNLGNLLNQQGQLSEAAQCFRAALRCQPNLVEAYNNLANALKAMGRLDEAIAQYRDAVRIAPDYAEGYYNLGLALKDAGRPDEAIAAYREALRIRPDFVEAQFNLGGLFRSQGLLPEALNCFEHVVARMPDFAEGLCMLGIVLRGQGRPAEARAALDRAIALKPGLIDAHQTLGNLYFDQGKPDAAIASYQTVVRINPAVVDAHTNLGSALRAAKRFDEAADAYRAAIKVRPECVEAHTNLGQLYLVQGRLGDAIACQREALRLRPDFAPAHNALGAALETAGQWEEALASFRDAVRLQPGFGEAYNNLGAVLKKLGKPGEALVCFEEALRLSALDAAPGSPAAGSLAAAAGRPRPLEALSSNAQAGRSQFELASIHNNRAMTLLLLGNFAEGWPEYEWRWHMVDPAGIRKIPLWDGSPLRDQTVLLPREQGMGDTLHFIRYAPLVQARGAKLVVTCPKRWIELLSTCAGLDRSRVEFRDEQEPLPRCDLQAPLLSLPGILKTDLNSIPHDVPYLSVCDELVARWRERMAGAGEFRVGINWQGNLAMASGRLRAIPLELFAPLAKIEGVRLFSLQKGAGTEQLAQATFPIEDLGSERDEGASALVDTAAVIKNLDLVISSDTAVVHLAGALAAPVWMALPLAPDWRWLLDRSDSPWYPTLRLFRQSRPGDWSEVFERIAGELPALVAAKLGG